MCGGRAQGPEGASPSWGYLNQDLRFEKQTGGGGQQGRAQGIGHRPDQGAVDFLLCLCPTAKQAVREVPASARKGLFTCFCTAHQPRRTSTFLNGPYIRAYITSLILTLDLRSPKHVLSGSLRNNFPGPWTKRMPSRQFLSGNRQMYLSSPRENVVLFQKETNKQYL